MDLGIAIEKSVMNSTDEAGAATDWNTLNLPGKTLELIDESIVQILRFEVDGNVIATLGTRDGAVAGPILFWEVKNGILVISKDQGLPAIVELRKPPVQGAVLSVFGRVLHVTGRSGEKFQYKLSQKRNVAGEGN